MRTEPPQLADGMRDPLLVGPDRVFKLDTSGEFEAMVPVANARRSFELLGTPADKRHVIAIGGHFIPRAVVIRKTIDRLDQRLGTVAD